MRVDPLRRDGHEASLLHHGHGYRSRQDYAFGAALCRARCGLLEADPNGHAGIGTDRTLDEVYKFVPPVSPDLAARWAGVEIDLGRINMPSSLINDWLIVEGAGGVLVPINQKQFMLDMMVKFKLPVVVAARSSLGTVNHTLLTLAALHAAELPVHGVVLIGDQNRENRETIERFGHVRVIGEIPKLPNLHRTALMQVFMNHFDRAAFAQ
jgi:dethiobiotin synthetase